MMKKLKKFAALLSGGCDGSGPADGLRRWWLW